MAHDESFFREVAEDLRAERFKTLWQRFGVYLIGLVVLLVLATGAKVAYDYWRANQAAAAGDTYMAALDLADAKKDDDALKALSEIQASGDADYAALATLRAAGIKAEKGDVKSALADFTRIGADTKVPAAIRDAARIRAAFLLVDNGTYKQVEDQVKDLTDAENAFRSSAREALGLSAWKAGDVANARKWFELIAGDNGASSSASSDAQMMLDLIQAGDKPA